MFWYFLLVHPLAFLAFREEKGDSRPCKQTAREQQEWAALQGGLARSGSTAGRSSARSAAGHLEQSAGLAVRTRLSLWHKSIVRGRPEAKPRAEICGSARCSARHSCSLDQAGTRGWEPSFIASTSQVRWGRQLLSGTALFTAARSKVGSRVWCIRAGRRYRQYRQPQLEE